MAYVSVPGGQVYGELYLLPPDENNNTKLMAQLYNGQTLELINFGKPVESPEHGSIIDRINRLEDILVAYMGSFEKTLNYLNADNSWSHNYSSFVNSRLVTLASRTEMSNPSSIINGFPNLDNLDTVLDDVVDEDDNINEKIIELKEFISTRDTLNETDKEFLIRNIEALASKRGG